ncbi:MAG: VWA domain-containing protein, partial [Alphaproteobacteria bacterium]
TRCLSHGVTPLQSNKTTIKAAIDELTSPTGTTNIPQGLAWAWRVLVNDAPFDEATDNPQGRRTQAIILLTDGENYGGVGDGYKTQFGKGSAAQNGGANQRLLDVASTIKAQGILVYTIQFGEMSDDLEALLKAVASGPDAPFYQKAPSREALEQVFREVANDLSQLRVSR